MRHTTSITDDCTLLEGDCLDLMSGIPDGSVDLTVTSPPYDNLRTYNGSLVWCEQTWKCVLDTLFRISREGAVVVWIVGDATCKGSETGTSFKQALYAKSVGFNIHDTMIWQKPNPIPRTHRRYEQAFEYMFVFSKGPPNVWNPKKVACKNAGKPRGGTIQQSSDGIRLPKHKGGVCAETKQADNVWCLAGSSRTKHPAEFPEQLAMDHIHTWSDKDSTVLDPFLGSGTTGVAARKCGRKFIGIEKDPQYFQIASERIFQCELDLII